jgi:hypothetical protein
LCKKHAKSKALIDSSQQGGYVRHYGVKKMRGVTSDPKTEAAPGIAVWIANQVFDEEGRKELIWMKDT